MTTRLRTLPARISTQAELLANGALRIRIQKELKNFNANNRHGHWSGRHRDRQEWQALLINALVDGLGFGQTLRLVGPSSGLPGAVGGLQCRCAPKPGRKTKRCVCPDTSRRRLTITRWVPSPRNFARDVLNRMWVVKQAQDAVKSLGLLRDDSDRWCELRVLQSISPDGLFWTEFLIERLPPAAQQEDIAC